VIWTASFWKQTAERAVKTAAQTGAAFLVIGTTGIADIDWATTGGICAVAALASVLTSLASNPFGPADSPSLVEVD
jgi:hypothetical protein